MLLRPIPEIQEEEQRKEVELDIRMAVKKARRYGISDERYKEYFFTCY